MVALPTTYAAAPLDADDQVYLQFTADTDNEVLERALDNMPTDFQSMNSLSRVVDFRRSASGDDTLTLGVRIVDASGNILAATDSSGTFHTVSSNVNLTTDTPNGPAVFLYVNQTATKEQWDGARVQLRQGYTRNMGADVQSVWVDYVRVTGDYTASAPVTNVAVGQALETDTAQPVVPVKPVVVPVGQALETDTAHAVATTAPIVVPVGQALETDTAQSIVPGRRFVLGVAVESDALAGG